MCIPGLFGRNETPAPPPPPPIAPVQALTDEKVEFAEDPRRSRRNVQRSKAAALLAQQQTVRNVGGALGITRNGTSTLGAGQGNV